MACSEEKVGFILRVLLPIDIIYSTLDKSRTTAVVAPSLTRKFWLFMPVNVIFSFICFYVKHGEIADEHVAW